jgi:serine/threonine-protein kinase
VLLYELLTGTTPFDKERFKEVGYDELRRIIREEEPPKPSTRISTMGQASTTISTQRKSDPKRLCQLFRGELDWIVMKALEKDRNRRYETASAFAADVQHYLHDEPVQACPPSAWYRFRKFTRRKKMALGVAAGLFLALAGIAGAIGWAVRDRAAGRTVREHEVERALQEVADASKADKLPEALAAVKQAEGFLAGGEVSEELQQSVGQWRADLSLVGRLEEARLAFAAGVMGGGFDYEGMDRALAAALRDYDLDVERLDPQEIAQQVGRSQVHAQLVAAMDLWASAQMRLNRAAAAERLWTMTRLADADPWRCRLRDAAMRGDRAGLDALAQQEEALGQPAPTLVLLCLALHDAGALESAAEIMRKAQQRHPNNLWLNQNLGVALYWQFRWKKEPARLAEAAGFLRAAVALRPDSPGAHCSLGGALNRQGKQAEAEAEHREALRLHPNFTEARVGLGNALDDQGKHDAAIAEYRIALGLRPDFALTHYNLGLALRRLRKQVEAEAAYREALRLRPNYPDAHGGLADVLVSLGRLDEAVKEYRTALQQRPDFPEAAYLLGLTLKRQGKYDEAEAAFREAVRLQPSYVEAHQSLLFALNNQGKYAAAVEAFRVEVRLRPESVRPGFRYNPACAAALASCGQGQDVAGLDAKERARLRRQALEWLRADLDAWGDLLEREPDNARTVAIKWIKNWLVDPDFAGVRGEEALAKLPEAERPAWRQLWADLAEMLARVQSKMPVEEGSGRK